MEIPIKCYHQDGKQLIVKLGERWEELMGSDNSFRRETEPGQCATLAYDS